MKTTLEPFYIVGISVRTTNENQQAATDIPALWNRFFAENIPAKIDNKISEDIYCLYTDYESDYTKPYTTVLGFKVKDLEHIPEGLTGKTVPGKAFEVFTASGKTTEGFVFNEWVKIWNTNLDRAYSGDFEIYGPKAADPEHAEVEIFISLH